MPGLKNLEAIRIATELVTGIIESYILDDGPERIQDAIRDFYGDLGHIVSDEDFTNVRKKIQSMLSAMKDTLEEMEEMEELAELLMMLQGIKEDD